MVLRWRPWNANYENLASGVAYSAAVRNKLFCIIIHVDVDFIFMMDPKSCEILADRLSAS